MIDVLPALIAIITCAVILTAFLYVIKVVSYKEEIRQLARGYMLEMETVGYLSPEAQAGLIQQLSDRMLEDIDLSGTTDADAGYGNTIYLSIHAAVPTKYLDTSSGNMFSFFFADSKWTVDILLQSTAKH